MVYGELGVYPFSVSVKVRMVNFWSKLVNGKESKLSNTLYRYIYWYNKIGFTILSNKRCVHLCHTF
jgi:hypothetical protein